MKHLSLRRSRRRSRSRPVIVAAALALLATSVPTASLAAASDREDRPVNQVYFASWSIYDREHHLKDLVDTGTAEQLTHVAYSLGALTADGDCLPGDPWADFQRPFSASEAVDGVADDPEQPLRGNLNQLRKLKERYPHLTVTAVVGGEPELAPVFAEAAATPQSRERFAANCVDTWLRGDMTDDEGMVHEGIAAGIIDGIDIDWEWPDDDTLDEHVALLTELREQLDAFGADVGRTFELHATMPAFVSGLEGYDLAGMFEQVDYSNIQVYNLAGAWRGDDGEISPDNLITRHDGQLYVPDHELASPHSANAAVEHVVASGGAAEQILLGLGAFGRVWTEVPAGPNGDGLYQQSQDTPAAGSVASYVELRDFDGAVFTDEEAATAYAYDGTNWWTYETPETARAKAEYAVEHGLGGVMMWASYHDPTGELVDGLHAGLSAAG